MDETRKILEEILDAKEISELEMFLERPAMVEALRKVLFWPVTHQGVFRKGKTLEPHRNFLLGLVASSSAASWFITNAAIGKQLRIQWEAIKLVQQAFEEIKRFQKKVVQTEVKENVAR